MKKLTIIISLLLVCSSAIAGSYKKGESVYVKRGSSQSMAIFCDAVIIMSGEDKSKIEYTDRCRHTESLFPSDSDYHPQGYQEWVPNFSLFKSKS